MTERGRRRTKAKKVERVAAFGTEWRMDEAQMVARELASRARRANLGFADLAKRTGIRERKIQGVLRGYLVKYKMGDFLREEFVTLLLDPSLEIDPSLANALLILAARADVLGEIQGSGFILEDLIALEEWQRKYDAFETITRSRHPAGRTPPPDLFTWSAASGRLLDLQRAHIDSLRNNLPTYRTTFVGREVERHDVLELLRQPGLVTLWGSPGCGKSRLAVEAANEAKVAFHDGAWWVDLARVIGEASLIRTIAAAVRVQLKPERSSDLDGLVYELRPQRSLLILDNCERLTAMLRPVVQALAEGCPFVRLVATSRKLLDAEGEHPIHVEPLPPPDLSADSEHLVQNESVRLFLDRMPATPTHGPGQSELRAIAEICERAQGIPLAIEIIAPHTSRISPQRLLQVLSTRLLDLKHVHGHIDPRHETLRAAIAWSVQELTEGGRASFASAAVFPAGCNSAAVAAVQQQPDAEVEDAVQRLIECSLAERIEPSNRDARTRIRLLQPIREFALNELFSSDELRSARLRLAEWCSDLLRSLPDSLGSDQVAWRTELDREYDNVREALHASIESREALVAYSIAARAWRIFDVSGRWVEGLDVLERVVSLGDEAPLQDRVDVLRGAGLLARLNGDLARSREMFEKAVLVSRATGEAALIARSLGDLSHTTRDLGDPDRALVMLREVRGLYQELGDRVGMARADMSIGLVLLLLRDHEEATRLLMAALPVIAGDRRNRAAALNSLALAHLAQGQFDAAVSVSREALSATQQWDDVPGSAITSVALGMALGGSGAEDEARSVARRALGEFAALRYPQGLVRAIEILATEAVRNGAPARAIILASAAVVRRPRHPMPVPPAIWDRYLADIAAARQQLAQSKVEACEQVGTALSDEEVIALGFAEPTDDRQDDSDDSMNMRLSTR